MAINSRVAVRMAIIIVITVMAVLFLWRVRGGLYPFIIAFFIAYLLNPAVNWLENRRLNRVWAIIYIYIVLFAIVVVGGSLMVPFTLRELESFARELPVMVSKGEILFHTFQWTYQNSTLPASLRTALDGGIATLQGQLQAFVASAVDGILSLLSNIIGLAISPILAFYLLLDWHELNEEMLHFLPSRWRRRLFLLLSDLDRVLSGIIRGQLTIAVIVGILVSAGLFLLGVRYALIIGILAGILDVIPYFGAFIGATPAVTVAFLSSPLLALKVALLFFLIHQLESTVIGPKIIGGNIGLHPLSVIFFLFVGEEIGGLLGMLLGVPVAALAKVVLKHLAKALI